MGSLISQIQAVVAMNLRSLPQRIWMSLATLFAVAIVVAVLLAFLSMANGFQQTVKNTGSENLAVILRAGAQSELNSVITRDQINLLSEAPGVAHNDGSPVVSRELYVTVDGTKRSSQTDVNLPLRGISENGISLREGFTIVEGRMFEPGKNEIVVGSSVLREFSGFELGNSLRFGKTTWTVVGVFEAGASVFASELWTDVRTLQSQFNRGSSAQVIRVALEKTGDISAIAEYIDKEPRLNMDVKTEAEYYQEQAKAMSDMIFFLGWPLAIAMALGALAGALNTMYNSVAQRAVEIATLRAIGFRGVAAFFGTLVESLVLAFIGGILGTIAAFLLFDGISASTLGGSFTQIVFSFELSSDAFVQGITLAVIIGLVGGFFPALKASRVPVMVAFSVDP